MVQWPVERAARRLAMECPSKLDVEAYLRAMRETMEAKLRQVAKAVNAAPDGAWINGSEMEVRDIFGELRREAFEKALQMRLDAAQAAFSPGGPGERETAVKQGLGNSAHAHGQRPD